MGTCFGIVPYVDGPNTGTIAGIVGAGGNVGAVIFLNVFKSQGDSVAFTFMATFSLAAALLTPLIVIKGYRGILFGKERKEKPAMLTVPVSGSY
jgi:NNP family nitrate/nitrite transporter-like MFS transporter